MTDPVGEIFEYDEREVIELAFPSRPDLVVLARFAAATAAARAGFDLEEIEDLRLAVDELFVSFGPVARNGCMRLELDRSADTIRVVGSFEGFEPPESSDGAEDEKGTWERAAELSELLLDSLVDEHGRETRDGRAVVWLRKKRAANI